MLKNKKKIGLIAGGGDVPLKVIDFCSKNSIDVFMVSVKGFCDINRYKNKKIAYIETSIGFVGKTIKFFRKNNIKEVVAVGNLKKPSFTFIKMDWSGLKLLRKILKNKILGDNSILETVVEFFKENGLNIVNVNKYLETETMTVGFNGKIKFRNKEYLEDIKLGVEFLKHISKYDMGQSVVIQQKTIVAVEGCEGTDKLIERCKDIKRSRGRGAILVKIKKTNQTDKIDLPTIGINTIKNLKASGFVGLAFDCKNCLVINSEEILKEADKLGIWVYGIENNI